MSQHKHPYADILIAIANGEQFDHVHNFPVTSEHILEAISRNNFDPDSVKIKQKTMMINGHEVPEPLKVKPKYNTTYYYPSIGIYIDTPYNYSHWTDDVLDNERFNCGILHSTEEAAIKHAEALLSFTKVKE